MNAEKGTATMTESTAVEQAQKVIGDLEDELESRNGRAVILHKKHESLAFAAATGDKKARAGIVALNAEITDNDSEIEVITAALVEARSRLATAERTAAIAADQADAVKAQELIAAVVERWEMVDEAIADIVKALAENKLMLTELRRFGVDSPTDDMIRINCVLAMKWLLQQTPWHTMEFEKGPHFLAPHERRNFTDLAKAWGATMQNQIVPRLPRTEEAA